jgi:hypothetical protein
MTCRYCNSRPQGCPACTPPPPPPYNWHQIYAKPDPKGCVCPPMADLTCQRPDCGRKPQPPASAYLPDYFKPAKTEP